MMLAQRFMFDLFICQSSSLFEKRNPDKILISHVMRKFLEYFYTDNLTFVEKSDNVWMCKKQGNS
jgi:hypothetical protein